MLLSLILLSIIVLCLTLIWYAHLTEDKRLIAKIPGPKVWPIVGNCLSYVMPPEELFTHLRYICRIYNGTNQAHAINGSFINIYDPDDIETILSSTHFITKQIPYNFLKPWLSEGLLVSSGAKWHQRRKLLTKAFHFNILKKYMRTVTEQTEIFLDRVAKVEGKATDIVPLITETTLQIICETTLGTFGTPKTQSLSKKYFKAIQEFGEILTTRICRIWLYVDFIFMFTTWYKIQKEVQRKLHEFTVSIIEDRKEQHKCTDFTDKIMDSDEDDVYKGKGRLAMLDLLLQNEKEGKIDFEGVREEVDTFVFEGHDTTAMALSFFILRIANEPTAQNKIFEEMQSIFGDSKRSPTTEDLGEMKYLDCCIKESLRLYPSVPFIARYISEEVTLSVIREIDGATEPWLTSDRTVILSRVDYRCPYCTCTGCNKDFNQYRGSGDGSCGYRVPPGTVCQIHVFDLHRSEKIYPRPDEFIPERFLPENNTLRHPYAYIPFSAGPRNCIGQKFAMQELKTLLSGLLRRFRVEPITKPEDLIFRTDIVLRTSNPIYVRFSARE